MRVRLIVASFAVVFAASTAMADPPIRLGNVAFLHPWTIRGIAVSADGTRIATIETGNSVRLWSRAGEALRTWQHPRGWPTLVQFAGDGTVIAASQSDISSWSSDQDAPRFVLEVGKAGFGGGCVALSPDGSLAAVANSHPSHTVAVWSLVERKRLVEQARGIGPLAFDSTGKRLAISAARGIEILSAADLTPVGAASGSVRPWRLAWMPDGNALLVAIARQVSLCPLGSGPSPAPIAEGGDGAYEMQLSPDGRELAIGSAKTIELRNLDGKLLASYPGDLAAYSADGRWLVIAVATTVTVVERASGTPSPRGAGHIRPPQRVVFTPDGKGLISTDLASVIHWDLASRTARWHLACDAYAFALTDDGRDLLIGTLGFKVLHVGLASGLVGSEWTAGPYSVTRLEVSPDGKLVATHADRPRDVSLLPERQPLLPGWTSNWELALSADGKWLASVQGRALRVWSVAERSQRATYPGESFALWSDGSRVALRTDKGVRLVDDAGGPVIALPDTGPDSKMRCAGGRLWTIDRQRRAIAWDADGKRVWSSGEGRLLEVSSDGATVAVATSGTTVIRLSDGGEVFRTGLATAAAISSDGKWIALRRNERVEVLELPSGTPRVTLAEPDARERYRLRFSADGSTLVGEATGGTVYDGAHVRVWDLATGRERCSARNATLVGLAPDGSWVVCETLPSTSRREVFGLVGPDGSEAWRVRDLYGAVASETGVLATADGTPALALRDPLTGDVIGTFAAADSGAPLAVHLRAEGRFRAASLHADGSLVVWDHPERRALCRIPLGASPSHKEGALDLIPAVAAFGPDGRVVAALDLVDGRFLVWSVDEQREISTVRCPWLRSAEGDRGIAMSLDPTGRYAAVSRAWGGEARVQVFALADGRTVLAQPTGGMARFCAARSWVAVSGSGRIRVYDLATGGTIWETEGSATDLAFSPDATRLAVAGPTLVVHSLPDAR